MIIMLQIDNLAMGYGGIAAVRGVSLTAAVGQMIGLVGPNGAGKTSLLNTICGLYRPKSGSVRLDGVDVVGLPAHQVARRGLIQVPEGRQVLGPMSVEDNLELGRLAAVGRAPGQLDHVYALFPILAERRRQLAGSLSGGQQQMLAIGRALMGSPRVLLLDEPSLGLSPILATQVFKALVDLNREGLTILLVEQNARRAFAATSYAYVMERGTIAQHGASASLAEDPAIIAHYLGTR
jgi:branched-chain amino acid transport system ATP-binding protein